MDSSPFERIPGEIRNQIYTNVLQRSGHVKLYVPPFCRNWPPLSKPRSVVSLKKAENHDRNSMIFGTRASLGYGEWAAVGLMGVSRLIRAETRSLYVSVNEFRFFVHRLCGCSIKIMADWVRRFETQYLPFEPRSILIVLGDQYKTLQEWRLVQELVKLFPPTTTVKFVLFAGEKQEWWGDRLSDMPHFELGQKDKAISDFQRWADAIRPPLSPHFQGYHDRDVAEILEWLREMPESSTAPIEGAKSAQQLQRMCLGD